MTLMPRSEDRDKYCFTYCGDDRCNCQARPKPTLLEEFLALQRRDLAASRKITDAGGIDCTMRRSDRIGP